jgi:predicted flap endonuclease-1-like 5' DNA nuclease
MADDFEVDPVIAHMAESGGDVGHYRVEAEVAEAITAAAAAQVVASEAVDDAVDEVEEEHVAEAAEAVADEAPDLDDESAAAVAKLVAVTGLSVDEASKLYNAGVEKASDLLELTALPDGRVAISEATGLDSDQVLYAAKRLDLMRVKGVGVKYSALLIASGVDTVPELATRNPANLSAKMGEVNEADEITEVVPSEEVVSDWVAQAKDLPRMLYY